MDANEMTKRRIRTIIGKIREWCVTEKILLDEFLYEPAEYKKGERPPVSCDGWKTLKHGAVLEGVDKHFWICKTFQTPERTSAHSKLFFELKTGREGKWDGTNPQCLVFLNGKAVQGMDINHTELELSFGTEYNMQLYMYGGMEEAAFFFMPSLVVADSRLVKLYYDMQVPYECLPCLNERSEEAVAIVRTLDCACNLLDLRVPYSEEFYASAEQTLYFLEEEFYRKKCEKNGTVVSCIGHTHIDVAWMWTLAQTEEKVQRSFATVLKLMDEYPEYKFMSSQPQLYKYLKQFEPELYEKVKERVKEGRWEAEGAMWLEADCNLISGESLVRQIMFGKRFFQEEFGVESKILWLPDVFGYSAALPQILKKSGVDKFVTSKISWNETNQMPYDVFLWEGMDGTEIFTAFMTAQAYSYDSIGNCTTYVSDITPAQVMGSRKRFQQKEYTNHTFLTFGFGDGGGGPTRKMLEYHERLKQGIPGMPRTVIEQPSTYFAKLEQEFYASAKELRRIPKWVGELYLEFHRGTYTSMAKNKRNNRKSELLFQTAEQVSAVTQLLLGKEYPQKELNDSWETILLNQFHDIIPGSSIEEVYAVSDIQYAHVAEVGQNIVRSACETIACHIDKNAGTVIYNPNSFTVSGAVEVDGICSYVEAVPAMGWRTVKTFEKESNLLLVTEKKIDTPFYVIEFDENMNMASIYDKENGREIIKAGECANVLEAFEDLPYDYDNWELSPYYKQKKYEVNDVASVEVFHNGERAGLKIARRFLSSFIMQTVSVYEHSRRIDVENEIDWKESHIVLKAAFPFDIHAGKAVYETQFGYLERPNHSNTSWDAAKFEVCAHKYADISEDDYGVALLNDCKYGYNAEGSTLKLTLLKCGTYPNKNADKERHHFTYSILPHAGNHKQGGVIQEAYFLNRPLVAFAAKGDGILPESYSLVSCNCSNIITETVKKAEESNRLVVRAYDAYDRKSKAEFTFGFEVKKAYLCDLMENIITELEITDGRKVLLPVSNFEIVTLMAEAK